jgi:hypothetical protein
MHTRRRFVPERMDDPAANAAEIEASLRFIRLVNRFLGGARGLIGALAALRPQWPGDRPLRWLDLGTGAADLPLAAQRWADRRGLPIECVAIDSHPRVLEVAARALRGESRVELLDLDAAAALDRFGENAFDLVHAGMFLHHLPDEGIVGMLAAMGRLARIAAVWNDLRRSRIARTLVSLATLPLHPSVRFDATVSVDKGFWLDEARALATAAGLETISLRRVFASRFVLVARRPGGGDPHHAVGSR